MKLLERRKVREQPYADTGWVMAFNKNGRAGGYREDLELRIKPEFRPGSALQGATCCADHTRSVRAMGVERVDDINIRIPIEGAGALTFGEIA